MKVPDGEWEGNRIRGRRPAGLPSHDATTPHVDPPARKRAAGGDAVAVRTMEELSRAARPGIDAGAELRRRRDRTGVGFTAETRRSQRIPEPRMREIRVRVGVARNVVVAAVLGGCSGIRRDDGHYNASQDITTIRRITTPPPAFASPNPQTASPSACRWA